LRAFQAPIQELAQTLRPTWSFKKHKQLFLQNKRQAL
jgi:hypothetical protein